MGNQTKEIHRFREVVGLPPLIVLQGRAEKRMSSTSVRKQLQERDGFHCRFCGIPVIDKKIRTAIRDLYPIELRWGSTNSTQHAAFQCMWLHYDHVLPHCRGGDNSLDNLVITCAPCNFGKLEWTIEELGLLDPRERPPKPSSWDGLSRFVRLRS